MRLLDLNKSNRLNIELITLYVTFLSGNKCCFIYSFKYIFIQFFHTLQQTYTRYFLLFDLFIELSTEKYLRYFLNFELFRFYSFFIVKNIFLTRNTLNLLKRIDSREFKFFKDVSTNKSYCIQTCGTYNKVFSLFSIFNLLSFLLLLISKNDCRLSYGR